MHTYVAGFQLSTIIEPTLDYTTALGGGDHDYDQTYDDIGGIYDSCDDYNYNSDPADDR